MPFPIDERLRVNITDDIMQDCLDYQRSVVAEGCEDQYTDEEFWDITDITLSTYKFKCITAVFDWACENFIRKYYVDALLESLYPNDAPTYIMDNQI